ncbi:MAG: SRPBCC family protein [Candidatus Binatia bacterium]
MKTHHFQTEQWLAQPLDRIFKFFADPENLERLTPPWLSFQIRTRPDIKIEKGTLLDYRLRLRGIPLRWQSEITVWEPPCRFVDRQTKGPYSLWVHEHTFTDDNNGTLIGDRVEYAAPGGRLVHKYLIEPDLEKIFRYRKQVLGEIFQAEGQTANITHARHDVSPK